MSFQMFPHITISTLVMNKEQTLCLTQTCHINTIKQQRTGAIRAFDRKGLATLHQTVYLWLW